MYFIGYTQKSLFFGIAQRKWQQLEDPTRCLLLEPPLTTPTHNTVQHTSVNQTFPPTPFTASLHSRFPLPQFLFSSAWVNCCCIETDGPGISAIFFASWSVFALINVNAVLNSFSPTQVFWKYSFKRGVFYLPKLLSFPAIAFKLRWTSVKQIGEMICSLVGHLPATHLLIFAWFFWGWKRLIENKEIRRVRRLWIQTHPPTWLVHPPLILTLNKILKNT